MDALATSSAAAVRSACTESKGVEGITERPASPQTNRLFPEAAGGALKVTVAVLLAPLSWPSTKCVTSAAPATADTGVTGQRHAHSIDTTCGPKSHKPPFSRRHGVLNGLPGCSAEPSQTATPPDQPPPDQPPRACWSASQARISVLKRKVKNTTEATPDASTAATSLSASSMASAIGFSSSRCLPASAARIASGACTCGGTANATASTASRNAPTSGKAVAPYSAASAPAATAFRPHTAESVLPGMEASAGACVILAQCPVPTRPNRIRS